LLADDFTSTGHQLVVQNPGKNLSAHGLHRFHLRIHQRRKEGDGKRREGRRRRRRGVGGKDVEDLLSGGRGMMMTVMTTEGIDTGKAGKHPEADTEARAK
jgi:hypothetical protein